jgi:hypothetical protein
MPPLAFRSRPCPSMRCRTDAGQQRAHRPAPPQPRRRPSREQRPCTPSHSAAMRSEPRTHAYLEKRTKQGLSKQARKKSCVVSSAASECPPSRREIAVRPGIDQVHLRVLDRSGDNPEPRGLHPIQEHPRGRSPQQVAPVQVRRSRRRLRRTSRATLRAEASKPSSQGVQQRHTRLRRTRWLTKSGFPSVLTCRNRLTVGTAGFQPTPPLTRHQGCCGLPLCRARRRRAAAERSANCSMYAVRACLAIVARTSSGRRPSGST